MEQDDAIARHIQERMAPLEKRFDTLIDKVRSVGDKIDRDFDRIAAGLDRGFIETQAMLRDIIERQ